MPTRSIKPCTWPGCGTLVTRGRCEKHGYHDRSGPTNPKYLSRYWKDLRAAHLRAHPLCVECFALGRVTLANTVDHKDGDDTNDDPSNFQSLCGTCHSRKTATQDGGFGNAKGEPRQPVGLDGWPMKPSRHA